MTQKEAFDIFVIYFLTGVRHYSSGEFDNKELSLLIPRVVARIWGINHTFFRDKYKSFFEKGSNANRVFTDKCINNICNMYQRVLDCNGDYRLDLDDEYYEGINKKTINEDPDIKDKKEDKKYYTKIIDYLSRIPYVLGEIGIKSNKETNGDIPSIIKSVLMLFNNNHEPEMLEIYHVIESKFPEVVFSEDAGYVLDANREMLSRKIISFSFDDIPAITISANYLDRIKAALNSEKHAAIINGPAGTGKFTIAVEYARKNNKNYEKTLCLNWRGSFEKTISYMSTSDDVLYQNESQKDRSSRKNEIWQNNTETVLLIIYDVSAKSANALLRKYANEYRHFIITVKEYLDESLPYDVISPEPLAEYVINNVAVNKLRTLDLDVNDQEFRMLKAVSGNNILVYNLILDFLTKIRNGSAEIIRKIYRDYYTAPYKTEAEENYKFSLNYHGVEKKDTLIGHLRRIFSIDELNDKQIAYLKVLSDFMPAGRQLENFDEIISALYLDNEIISQLEKKFFLKRTDKGCEIPVYIKHIFLDNTSYNSNWIINRIYQRWNEQDLSEKDYYFLGIAGIEVLESVRCRVKDKSDCLHFFQSLYSFISNLNYSAAKILLIPLQGMVNNESIHPLLKDVYELGLLCRNALFKQLIDRLNALYENSINLIDLTKCHVEEITLLQYALNLLLMRPSKKLPEYDVVDESEINGFQYYDYILTFTLYNLEYDFDNTMKQMENFYKTELVSSSTLPVFISNAVHIMITMLLSLPEFKHIEALCDLFKSYFETLLNKEQLNYIELEAEAMYNALKAYCGNKPDIKRLEILIQNGLPSNELIVILSSAMLGGHEKDVIDSIDALMPSTSKGDCIYHCNYKYLQQYNKLGGRSANINETLKLLGNIEKWFSYLNIENVEEILKRIKSAKAEIGILRLNFSNPECDTYLPFDFSTY